MGHRRKGLQVINSIGLGVAFSYQASLKSLNSSIRKILSSINSTTTHNRFARWQRGKVPGLILMKSMHFLIHGRLPTRDGHSLQIGARNGNTRQATSKRVKIRREAIIKNEMSKRILSASAFTFAECNRKVIRW
ncbi:hypothetical protein CsSME_00022334 [Camellia sinensis var. sinensis]